MKKNYKKTIERLKNPIDFETPKMKKFYNQTLDKIANPESLKPLKSIISFSPIKKNDYLPEPESISQIFDISNNNIEFSNRSFAKSFQDNEIKEKRFYKNKV